MNKNYIECSDIDECSTPSICQNGECDNTLGSYKCRCEEGYSVKPDQEGPGCTDDDECLLGTFNCDVNADCTNTQGGYECHCREGFTGNGQVCRDINECLTNNGGCDQDAQCINTEGSFKVCPSSFIFVLQLCYEFSFFFIGSVSVMLGSVETATSARMLTSVPTIPICARTASASTTLDLSVANVKWVSCTRTSVTSSLASVT